MQNSTVIYQNEGNIHVLLLIQQSKGIELFTLIFSMLIIAVGVVGNSLLSVTIAVSASLRTPMNTFVLSIGLVDLLTSMLLLPLRVLIMRKLNVNEEVEPTLYRVELFVRTFTDITRLFLMMSLSVERYQSIAKPLMVSKDQAKRRALIMSVTTLTVSTILSVISISYFCDTVLHHPCVDSSNSSITNWGDLEVFVEMPLSLLSISTIAISYGLIVMILKQQRKKMGGHLKPKINQIAPAESKKKAEISVNDKTNVTVLDADDKNKNSLLNYASDVKLHGNLNTSDDMQCSSTVDKCEVKNQSFHDNIHSKIKPTDSKLVHEPEKVDRNCMDKNSEVNIKEGHDIVEKNNIQNVIYDNECSNAIGKCEIKDEICLDNTDITGASTIVRELEEVVQTLGDKNKSKYSRKESYPLLENTIDNIISSGIYQSESSCDKICEKSLEIVTFDPVLPIVKDQNRISSTPCSPLIAKSVQGSDDISSNSSLQHQLLDSVDVANNLSLTCPPVLDSSTKSTNSENMLASECTGKRDINHGRLLPCANNSDNGSQQRSIVSESNLNNENTELTTITSSDGSLLGESSNDSLGIRNNKIVNKQFPILLFGEIGRISKRSRKSVPSKNTHLEISKILNASLQSGKLRFTKTQTSNCVSIKNNSVPLLEPHHNSPSTKDSISRCESIIIDSTVNSQENSNTVSESFISDNPSSIRVHISCDNGKHPHEETQQNINNSIGSATSLCEHDSFYNTAYVATSAQNIPSKSKTETPYGQNRSQHSSTNGNNSPQELKQFEQLQSPIPQISVIDINAKSNLPNGTSVEKTPLPNPGIEDIKPTSVPALKETITIDHLKEPVTSKHVEVVEMDGTVHMQIVTSQHASPIEGAVCLMNPRNREQGKRRVELKAALKVGLLVCCFVCLWMPLPISVCILRGTYSWTHTMKIDMLAVFSVLATSTAAVDPILYGLLNGQIRSALHAGVIKMRRKIARKCNK